MNYRIEKINEILADWNPIGVNSNLAKNEYRGYVPIIIKNINNKDKLLDCLIDILINKIGVGHRPLTEEQENELRKISEKLAEANH